MSANAVAVADAILGTALGLLVSAFAQTEFQAVQFMPLLVIPQILLCGLFIARDEMPTVLHAISDVLPLSYAVDAMSGVATPTRTGFAGVLRSAESAGTMLSMSGSASAVPIPRSTVRRAIAFRLTIMIRTSASGTARS